MDEKIAGVSQLGIDDDVWGLGIFGNIKYFVF